MNLGKEAKKLISTEARNLIKLRKAIKHLFYGTVAGSAFQILRIKKEMESILTNELINAKSFARKERAKLLDLALQLPDITEKDIVLSTLGAESFSNTWASAALSGLPLDPDARLRRLVATETSRSFSDVTMEAADKYNLVRRWNSILDSKVCKFCASMDGDETLPGETFKGGVEPGYVHPSCRCFSDLILK